MTRKNISASHSTNHAVWIVDDDRSIRWVLAKALEKEGLNISTFESGDCLLKHLRREQPTAIISDVRMPGINGFDLLNVLQTEHPNLPVIIMTAHSDLESTVAAYQGGAFEYLPKPFDIDEVVAVTHRAVAHSRKTDTAPAVEPLVLQNSGEIIGEAPAMQEVFRAIGRLSQSNITVLINGESGTGKELVAQALHHHSPRKHQPFIALNMAAIPKDLIETELFGHEKGAFTGAANRRQGRFEQANNGTLFLDEIGDMSAETQTRLLRVLADGEFYRLGGHNTVKVDVRIIAATHQNLEKLVNENRFREDLFHRLNVIRIHIPKLCDRREDIPKLTRHFFESAAKDLEVTPKFLLPETEKYLCKMAWPGNVRQLENTCRWITVMAPGREIHIDDLPPELLEEQSSPAPVGDWEKSLRHWAERALTLGHKKILHQAMPLFEKALIEIALKHSLGRKKDAADLLGWGRNTLTRKLKELRIDGVKDIDDQAVSDKEDQDRI
ncbi:MAG: two-component system nitrogen regulation response regulator GlnG [Cellvibrionaceae bacterium]|jgi:two-component system nitrogen regulation response regulator GlnG